VTTATTFELGPIQLKILETLRTTTVEQIVCNLISKRDDATECCCCVTGLILHKVLGMEPHWKEGDVRGYFIDHDAHTEHVGYMPDSALDQIGMRVSGERRLLHLNDSLMLSFGRIADEIEARPIDFFYKSA